MTGKRGSFGVVFDFFDEKVDADLGGMFVGLAEAGPGVGEAGELVGVVAAFADGFEDEGTDEEIAAEMGGGAIFSRGGGGEVVDTLDESEVLIAFGLGIAPLEVVGVKPTGHGDAEIPDEEFFVGSGAGPDEGIGVTGFEVERGDIAVGGLGEEPFTDAFVGPTVIEFAVDFVTDGLGEQSETAAGFAHGGISGGEDSGDRSLGWGLGVHSILLFSSGRRVHEPSKAR